MDIQNVFVVGAGQMGAGIAQVSAMSGRTVRLYDVNIDIVEKSKAKMEKALLKQVEKGRMTQEDMEGTLKRIVPVSSLEEAQGCELAIEAVSENLDIKRSIFSKLDEVMPLGTIIASNTSSISITSLAAFTKNPERVVGMHFFNPVPVMKLVEIVKGLLSAADVIATAKEYAASVGKVPIVCKDSPGFVVNRIFDPMLNEAAYLVQEGVATPEEIDIAMVNGLNHPMGPLALLDLIGIDVIYAVMQVLHRDTGDQKYRPCPLLKQMIDAGLLGRKSKKGFYEYE